jgi:predicted PurR-regulated permease PerM
MLRAAKERCRLQTQNQPPPEPALSPLDAITQRRPLSISITPRSVWLASGIVLALLAALFLVSHALGSLLLIFIAIILGEAIRPLVTRLEQRRFPRALAVLLIYLVGALVLGGLGWLCLTPLVAEVGSLATHAPELSRRIQAWLQSLAAALRVNQAFGQLITNLTHALAAALQSALPGLISLPVNAVGGLFNLLIRGVLLLTLTLFWLLASDRLKPYLLDLLPSARREQADVILASMGRSLGGYVRGVLIAMLLIGVLTTTGLLLLHVPYALVLGLLAGLTELIPYVGPWISGTVAVVVALVTAGPGLALGVIVLFVVVQTVEGNAVQPLVMSRAVHLDPFLVLVAIVVGSELLGFLGAILAVPVAALAQTLFQQVLAPIIRQAAARGTDQPSTPSPPSTPVTGQSS